MTTETAKITSAGLAACPTTSGLELHLTHVALGAGQYTPTGSETALADLRETAAILVGSKSGNQVTMTASFLASAYTGSAYAVGEVGFYAGDPLSGGILFAVISSTTRATPQRGGANTTNYTPTFVVNLAGTPSGSVTVTFDPTAGAAAAALAAHVAASNPHPQYDVLGVPVGALVPFAMATAPTNWLECDGSIKLRASYPALFTAIGTTFNTGGELGTQFRIPDMRGQFVRGWDHGRGVDASRAIGTTQADALQNITGTLGARHGGAEFAPTGAFEQDGTAMAHVTAGVAGADLSWTFDASRVARTAAETRPTNVSLMYCIKAL